MHHPAIVLVLARELRVRDIRNNFPVKVGDIIEDCSLEGGSVVSATIPPTFLQLYGPWFSRSNLTAKGRNYLVARVLKIRVLGVVIEQLVFQ